MLQYWFVNCDNSWILCSTINSKVCGVLELLAGEFPTSNLIKDHFIPEDRVALSSLARNQPRVNLLNLSLTDGTYALVNVNPDEPRRADRRITETVFVCHHSSLVGPMAADTFKS